MPLGAFGGFEKLNHAIMPLTALLLFDLNNFSKISSYPFLRIK
jgi:hypothetical protein